MDWVPAEGCKHHQQHRQQHQQHQFHPPQPDDKVRVVKLLAVAGRWQWRYLSADEFLEDRCVGVADPVRLRSRSCWMTDEEDSTGPTEDSGTCTSFFPIFKPSGRLIID